MTVTLLSGKDSSKTLLPVTSGSKDRPLNDEVIDTVEPRSLTSKDDDARRTLAKWVARLVSVLEPNGISLMFTLMVLGFGL